MLSPALQFHSVSHAFLLRLDQAQHRGMSDDDLIAWHRIRCVQLRPAPDFVMDIGAGEAMHQIEHLTFDLHLQMGGQGFPSYALLSVSGKHPVSVGFHFGSTGVWQWDQASGNPASCTHGCPEASACLVLPGFLGEVQFHQASINQVAQYVQGIIGGEFDLLQHRMEAICFSVNV